MTSTAAYLITKTAHCEVLEQGGAYRVMSSNNICLFETASPVKAIEYAVWFSAKKAA